MLAPPRASSAGTWPRRIFLGLIGLVVLVVGVHLVAGAFGKRHVAEARDAWERDFGSWDDVVRRASRVAPNDTARRVEALAATLGVDAAPRNVEPRPRPTAQAAQAARTSRAAYKPWLADQVQRESRAIDPPPEALTAYLASHARSLDELRALLLAGDVPRWEQDLESGFSAMPIPNLLGFLQLQEVLVADALVAAEEGASERAHDDLEASWILGRAFDDAPVLICQLISLADARWRVGALRLVGAGDAPWDERLRTAAARERTIEALQVESRAWLDDPRLVEDLLNDRSTDPTQRALVALGRPLVLAGLADDSRRNREALLQARSHGTGCARPLAGAAELERAVPWWNVLGGLREIPVATVMRRIDRHLLDAELTRLVLHVDAVRAATGSWPAELPAASEGPCPDVRWTYAVGADGVARLAIAEPVRWGIARGVVLPQRFELGP